MTGVAGLLSNREFVRPYTGLIAAAQSDPAVAKGVAHEVIAPRVDSCKARLKRAQDEGQVRADIDLDVAVEVLYGPIYHRLVLHTFPITTDQVDDILDLALTGLRPTKPRPRRPSR